MCHAFLQTSIKISTSCGASSTSRLWSFYLVRNNCLQSLDDGCVFSCIESDLLLAVATGAVFRVQGIWSSAR
jgi:hypothetical protein